MNVRAAIVAAVVASVAAFVPHAARAACDGNGEDAPVARVVYDDAGDAPYAPSPILRYDLDGNGALFPPFSIRSNPPCKGDGAMRWTVQRREAGAATAAAALLRLPRQAGRYTIHAFPVASGRERAQAELDAFDVLHLDAGHWAAFDRDGTYRAVADAGDADLYISRDAALEFPGGGVVLTDGDDGGPLPPGARRGKPFTELEPRAWRNDRAELTRAELFRDLQACRSSVGCPDMAARVLLIHTRRGAAVKLRIRTIDPFVASFEAADARGSFGF